MPTFAWEGKTRTGETKKGTMEAEDQNAVLSRLRTEQITVSKVRKRGKGLSLLSLGGGVQTKDSSRP